MRFMYIFLVMSKVMNKVELFRLLLVQGIQFDVDMIYSHNVK